MRATTNPVSNELTPRSKHLPSRSSKKLRLTRGSITFLRAFSKIPLVPLRVGRKRRYRILRNSIVLFNLRLPTLTRETTATLLSPTKRISSSRNAWTLLQKVKIYHWNITLSRSHPPTGTRRLPRKIKTKMPPLRITCTISELPCLPKHKLQV